MKRLCLILISASLCGCANHGIVSVGTNTYMVSRGGWPAMDGFACESDCYKAANQFCSSRHLALASSQTTVINGEIFAHNASCKLVFVATNLPPETAK